MQKRVETGTFGSQKIRQQVEIPHLPAKEIRFLQAFQYSMWLIQMVVIFQGGAVRDGQKKIPVPCGEAVGIEIADIGGVVFVDIAVPH